MLIFVLRYFFVYWILLGGSASEESLLRELNLELKDFPTTSCRLHCMHRLRKTKYEGDLTERHNNWADQSCTDHCTRENATTSAQSDKYQFTHTRYRMILVCRDDTSLTFRIVHVRSVGNEDTAKIVEGESEEGASVVTQRAATEKKYRSIILNSEDEDPTMFTLPMSMGNATAPQMQTTMANPNIDTGQVSEPAEAIYMIKVQSGTNATIYMFNENFFTIDYLQNSTTYTISALAVNAKHQYAVVARAQEYSTLQQDYTPGFVGDMQLERFLPDYSNERQLLAEITWQPAEDRTCYYLILYFDESGSDMTSMEIRNPRQLYIHTLENLTFSAVYKVGIIAQNAHNAAKESEMKWLMIQTPSCAKWYNYNFNICPPFAPKGLKVKRKYVRGNVYSLYISWKKAEHAISYYVIMVVDRIGVGRDYKFNVSKDSTAFTIEEIELNGTLYDVHLIACTPGGNSSTLLQEVNSQTVLLPDKSTNIALLVIGGPVGLISIIIMWIVLHYRCAKYRRHQKRCEYFQDLENKAPIDPKGTFDFPAKTLLTSPEDLTQFQLDLEEKIFFNDAMEIDRSDITLHEILGEGAFGLVRRGIYNDGKSGVREVAVKMLKDRPSADDVRAFRREIEVMKSVERHPNIVGIIGHCTKRYNEMLLLTEYCSFGNLLDFLRDEWKYLYDMNVKCSSASINRMCSRLGRNGVKKHQRRGRRSVSQTQRRNRSDSNSNSQRTSIDRSYTSRSGGCGTEEGGGGGGVAKVFSIDSNIIERLKFKYKNLNALHQRNSLTTATTTTLYRPTYDISAATTVTSIATINDSTPPPPPTPLMSPHSIAADNKSYGYEEICCNSCKSNKCAIKNTKVLNGTTVSSEAAMQQFDNEHTEQQQKEGHYTHARNCECQQNLLNEGHAKAQQQQQQAANDSARKSAGAVENKSYFRFLPEIVSEAALRQRQWQRRQARAAARNRALALSPTENSTTTTVTSAATTTDNFDHDGLSGTVRRQPLSTADLLDIARQVAVGMEFLAKNKVVHRDLAARNVLVAPDRTIKIADFGLSRDIYQENVYKKTGNGKLPIKWLALESMTHQVYTTQSDVWSYGILLYEIVTLGGTPYPSIPTHRLLHLLKTGYRMEKPRNCGPEFYNLMYACWNVNPGERPTFSEIIKILEDFMVDEPERQIETVLGVPNLECIEQYSPKDSQYQQQQQQQQKQQVQEQPQDNDEMLDTSNMDDSYLKPL
ncbi:tyrosine-protein kinase receptor torso [Bactrocera dorsalis]|uniref:receptor protein-tyrosine kinase n=1 Tax=Bactrocera dorsalis TaxID=27457 RepID=A0A6I9UNU1_BACDO|nr:tyrosine-protein kinase receptor torso [Bactrocera dorsalis]